MDEKRKTNVFSEEHLEQINMLYPKMRNLSSYEVLKNFVYNKGNDKKPAKKESTLEYKHERCF